VSEDRGDSSILMFNIRKKRKKVKQKQRETARLVRMLLPLLFFKLFFIRKGIEIIFFLFLKFIFKIRISKQSKISKKY
jgi:hypothetical protein